MCTGCVCVVCSKEALEPKMFVHVLNMVRPRVSTPTLSPPHTLTLCLSLSPAVHEAPVPCGSLQGLSDYHSLSPSLSQCLCVLQRTARYEDAQYFRKCVYREHSPCLDDPSFACISSELQTELDLGCDDRLFVCAPTGGKILIEYFVMDHLKLTEITLPTRGYDALGSSIEQTCYVASASIFDPI